MDKKEQFHWVDAIADRIIKERGNKKFYTVAAGITPSGTIHIGNFREIITVDLVAKALESKGKKVRFIYSWDDYDRLRKIPKNMPKQELLQKYLGIPIKETPDVYGCHNSYAEHLEKELEESLPPVNIKPEFIYQSKMYKACKYAEEIKYVLNNKGKIIEILNKYRQEHLLDSWWPVQIYCEKCKKDSTKILSYNGKYELEYKCECGFQDKIDFRKKGIVKTVWRVDWPMRQHYERVDFEPGGKEHYQQPGGSRITTNETFEALYDDMKHPIDLEYDFIIVKGVGGKMSSSLGNVIKLKDALEVYEPEILRFLFAGTRPKTEFAISFDADVIKLYADYDKLERIYFGKEEISEEKLQKQKRIYELSQVKEIPEELPFQPNFRHLSMLVQIYNGDIKKVLENYEDNERTETRAKLVWNWIKKYAPEEFKFTLQERNLATINEKEKQALRLLKERLEANDYDEDSLFQEFYSICQELNIKNTEFFAAAYKVLINKERGPKLASFIFAVGKKKVIEILETIK